MAPTLSLPPRTGGGKREGGSFSVRRTVGAQRLPDGYFNARSIANSFPRRHRRALCQNLMIDRQRFGGGLLPGETLQIPRPGGDKRLAQPRIGKTFHNRL